MPFQSSPSVRPDQTFRSPHTDGAPVPAEFLVLHYTACSLQGALDIFLSKKRAVSCHLLIDRCGRIFEPVPCWDGVCLKAFHAGRSRLNFSEKRVDFNNFSIGVELVNWNGNFYPYTESQYQSLFEALFHLQKLYPSLKDPNRITGHEHIAGFRGKADPGALFDWKRFFREVYACCNDGGKSPLTSERNPTADRKPAPDRRPRLSAKRIQELAPVFQQKPFLTDSEASQANLIIESRLSLAEQKQRLKRLLLNI